MRENTVIIATKMSTASTDDETPVVLRENLVRVGGAQSYSWYVANSKLNLIKRTRKRCIRGSTASNDLLGDNRYMSSLWPLYTKCIPARYFMKHSHAHVMLKASFSICAHHFLVLVSDFDQ